MKTDPKIVRYQELPASFYKEKTDSVFYSREWIEVLKTTYGFDFYTVYDDATGHFIIFAEVKTGGAKQLISLPFSDYVKTKKVYPKEDAALLSFIQKKYPKIPIRYKTGYKINSDFSWGNLEKRAFYHRLKLDSLSNIEKRQKVSFRNQVKKAQKKGVEVKKSTSLEALERFYAIYRSLRFQKFGIIPQPFRFFEAIYTNFLKREKAFVLEAIYKHKTIASLVVLEFNNVIYYKFGASNKEYLKLGPNNLLFQKMIEVGLNQKNTALDLGLSGTGKAYEGLRRFKESTGAEPFHITTVGTNQQFIPAQFKETKRLAQDISKIMVKQDLDLDTTDQLSALIYPYFV